MDTYDDIIDLPAWNPRYHLRMAPGNRAAQFAPFAALSGHEEAIRASGMPREGYLSPDAITCEQLNAAIADLMMRLEAAPGVHPEVRVSYFDEARQSTMTYCGKLRRFDGSPQCLIFEGGKKIPLSRVSDLLAVD